MCWGVYRERSVFLQNFVSDVWIKAVTIAMTLDTHNVVYARLIAVLPRNIEWQIWRNMTEYFIEQYCVDY